MIGVRSLKSIDTRADSFFSEADRATSGVVVLRQEVCDLGVMIDICFDERTVRHDFQSTCPNLCERSLDQPRSNASLACLRWHFGMGECHHLVGQPIVRHSGDAIGIKLKAGKGGIVADTGSHTNIIGPDCCVAYLSIRSRADENRHLQYQ
jgi:hypothetical protein